MSAPSIPPSLLGGFPLDLALANFNLPKDNTIMNSAPPGKTSQVGSVQALTRNLSRVSGLAVATSVFEFVQGSLIPDFSSIHSLNAYAFASAFRVAFMAAACLVAFGAFVFDPIKDVRKILMANFED